MNNIALFFFIINILLIALASSIKRVENFADKTPTAPEDTIQQRMQEYLDFDPAKYIKKEPKIDGVCSQIQCQFCGGPHNSEIKSGMECIAKNGSWYKDRNLCCDYEDKVLKGVPDEPKIIDGLIDDKPNIGPAPAQNNGVCYLNLK